MHAMRQLNQTTFRLPGSQRITWILVYTYKYTIKLVSAAAWLQTPYPQLLSAGFNVHRLHARTGPSSKGIFSLLTHNRTAESIRLFSSHAVQYSPYVIPALCQNYARWCQLKTNAMRSVYFAMKGSNGNEKIEKRQTDKRTNKQSPDYSVHQLIALI